MRRVIGGPTRPGIGKAPGRLAAVLLFAAALFQSGVAYAEHGHGGGGFHGGGFGGLRGGGFHGGGFGGFRGGGFHAGGPHGSGFPGFHGGGFRNGRFGEFHGNGFHHHGFRRGVIVVPAFGGWWWGDQLGWPYYYNRSGSNYGYGPYGQYWYYCSDPSGYYPYVTQCNTGWQQVPAG